MAIRDYYSATHKNLDIWVHADSGNDSNNGLTQATPIKSLKQINNIAPEVITRGKRVVIHLDCNAGSEFTLGSDYMGLSNFVQGRLVIDGGDGLVDAFTGEGGPYTSTAQSQSALTVSGAGWTADKYAGYWVQITESGHPQEGHIRMIAANTSDTLYVMRFWSAAFAGPIAFKIVKPRVLINAGGASFYWMLAMAGTSQVNVQRLRLTSSGGFAGVYGCTLPWWVLVSAFIFEGAGQFGVTSSPGTNFELWSTVLNLSTLAADTAKIVGVSSVGAGKLNLKQAGRVYSEGTFSNIMDVSDVRLSNFTNGGRYKKLTFHNATMAEPDNYIGDTVATPTDAYPFAVKGSADSGMVITRSDLNFKHLEVSGNTSHGIDASGSVLRFTEEVTGSGNGGAGLYAHSGSQVTIKSGSPPTLTGTVGNVAVNNPSYEDTTWAEVDTGEAFHSAQEATEVKEVA